MKLETIKVPELPESVESGSVLTLHAETSQHVEKDQLLFEIETDKVVLEVCAPVSGKITEINVKEGDEIFSNDTLAKIDSNAKKTEANKNQHPSPSQEIEKQATKQVKPDNLTQVEPPKTSNNTNASPENEMHLSPAMRQQLRNNQTPTGLQKISTRNTRRIKMTRIRKKIADHLLNAQKNSAILSTFNEINMKPVMDIRAQYKERFQEKHNAKLGFMSFFTKACAQALKEFEAVNAYIEGEEIVYHDYQDIGIAISSDRGLIVPILRNTEDMSFSDIESGIIEYAKKAKNNTITLNDLEGGTFTITNGGIFGSLLSTPILNPPQSAILGMHAINQKPWIENNEIVIRPIMMLALSYDHRIIDGREAVLFLRMVKELIEDPVQLLLDL